MQALPRFRIEPVRSAEDLDDVVSLFRAYAGSLEIDLAYQGFDAELAELPGRYAPPEGALLLARNGGGAPIGCVALRLLTARCCEMKRLYVTPQARGTGLGSSLVDAVIREARRLGHREMRLDTLPSMRSAIALYRKHGFEPTEPYYDTPIAGTVFMRRSLG